MQDDQSPYVCYCFGYTAADIAADVLANGRSAIMARITAARAAGRCQCALKHPKGR